MKLLVGLGNPGKKHQNNRHNVGFMFIDWLAGCNQFKYEKKIKAEIAKVAIYGKDFLLTKPQTFMNESGLAVKELMSRYDIQNTKYLHVVHDDLDLPFGSFKIQKGKGPRLHNGILSIEQILKKDDFWRIRIGVDARDPGRRVPGQKYVLMDFKKEEREKLNDVFEKIVKKFPGATSFLGADKVKSI